jgi:alpha-D-xyloside xylohydrolase
MHWVNFGDWSFNPQCWPDVPGMVEELGDMGVELAVTFWPYVTPAGAYFANFTRDSLFATALDGQPMPVETWAGQMMLVDQTNAAARAAFYAAFRQGYGRHGVRTVWLDGSEPERATSDNFGEVRLQGGTDSEVGEAWVQQHVRAMAEGFAGDGYGPDEFFLLPRSTWAGASRYSAGVWSGDISSTFDELALQVRVAQQMALSGHALWTNDGGGYAGGDLDDPVFQELIVRWMQASAFFPIMRLHGQRKGGPPDDQCGNTGGDNEPWLLAKDPAHYAAFAAVMQLRVSLRDYTLGINRVAVRTGLPMVRPMILAFPGDSGCEGEGVSDQWMYGPDFLVGPVLTLGATSRSVYLPTLANATWVYYWNGTDAGSGGGRVSVNTSAIGDFPLFVRTPTPPPRQRLPLASLFSPSRADVVTCATPQCYSEQGPNGNYSALFSEGAALATSEPYVVALPSPGGGYTGTTYQTAQLTNYWSQLLGDNADDTSGHPPGPSYTSAVIPNGFVLTTQAPGTLPLLLFTKVYNATHTDIAAFASQQGIAWAGAQGYTPTGTAGFVFEGM